MPLYINIQYKNGSSMFRLITELGNSVVIVEAILGQILQEGLRARGLYSKQEPRDIAFTMICL